MGTTPNLDGLGVFLWALAVVLLSFYASLTKVITTCKTTNAAGLESFLQCLTTSYNVLILSKT